jgi:hypothetical protein
LIGEITSELTIQTIARPNRFIYSVNSWLMEVNSIELKDKSNNVNSTNVEWTVYTRRRSILFQVSDSSLDTVLSVITECTLPLSVSPFAIR